MDHQLSYRRTIISLLAEIYYLMAGVGDLEAALRSGNEDRTVEELRKIKSKISPKGMRIRKVMDILQKSSSPRVRNAAAIALADMRAVSAKDTLIDLLRRDETQGSRGTLSYALDEIGTKIPIAVLVDVILGDSYEAQQEAVSLITADRAECTSQEWMRVKRKLEAALDTRNEAAGRALDYLSKHQQPGS
jgi:hypothetical protein